MTLLAFVIFLALTGIVLNHSADAGLDRKYISWSWLLDAYGLDMPEPEAGYAFRDHAAHLVGGRLFVDGRDVDQTAASLAGIVTIEPLVVVAAGNHVHVFLTAGDLVESIDLGASLPGVIERVGRAGDRAVLQSGARFFRSDTDVTGFETWDAGIDERVDWSVEAQPESEQLEALEVAWRGRGLTVERVLLDLHSGRVLALPGRLLLDVIGVGMILLGVSGLILVIRRNRALRRK